MNRSSYYLAIVFKVSRFSHPLYETGILCEMQSSNKSKKPGSTVTIFIMKMYKRLV